MPSAGRASRGRAIAAAPAQRERDDVAPLQARLVLRAQADRLATAPDVAIPGATRAAARHPVRGAAEAIAVERDRRSKVRLDHPCQPPLGWSAAPQTEARRAGKAVGLNGMAGPGQPGMLFGEDALSEPNTISIAPKRTTRRSRNLMLLEKVMACSVVNLANRSSQLVC